MRTLSATLNHANSDGSYSATITSIMVSGVRSTVTIFGPSVPTVTPSGASDYHTVSIAVDDSVPAGDIDYVIDPWYLDSVLQDPITIPETLGQSFTIPAVTATTSIVNPTAPLLMHLGDIGRPFEITMTDLDASYVTTPTFRFIDNRSKLGVTPFDGDTTNSILVNSSGLPVLSYSWPSSPLAGLYLVRFDVLVSGEPASSPTYLLRVLPS